MKSIVSLLNEAFVPSRVKEQFSCSDGRVELFNNIEVESRLYYRFSGLPDSELLSGLSGAESLELLKSLEYCRCRDRQEETEVLMKLIKDFKSRSGKAPDREYQRLWNSLFNIIRKFAFRKYRDIFEDAFFSLKELKQSEQSDERPANWKSIDEKITELERTSELRFHG